MSGLKLGDRFVQIGCADGDRLGAIAAKVGLSGHAAVVVADEKSADRAKRGAANAGVFIEIHQSPLARLPLDEATVDLAIVDDTTGAFAEMSEGERAALVRELARVVRPGGRAMVIGALPASGLSALLGRGSRAPAFDAGPTLDAHGFTRSRLLGEREGLRFVEALKPRSSS